MLSLTLKGRYTLSPIQHYQRTEWSLHCSMLSLRLKGRYTPPVNTSRGQSDLFTVQCCYWHSKADIPPPGQHYQRTEWSLHCSMLSLTLKGRYTSPVNTSRGQSDLLTVQCCHWDSKADITPPSPHLVNTSTGQSDLFTVQCCHWHSNADIPPFNTIRGQSDLFTLQCCHWDSKADIPPIFRAVNQTNC